MRSIIGVLASTFLLLSAFSAPPLVAWDSGGHELVATMAYSRLKPKAQETLTALAGELVNPERNYDAVTMACWMDDLHHSSTMPYDGLFLSWHYIDLGLDPRDPLPSFEPGDDNERHGNVVQALKRAMVVLQGGTDPYIKTRAVACAIVMHLMGDIHQPLHCATNFFMSHGEIRSDNGGNKEGVVNGPPGDPKFNLHAFWDSAYRASFDEAGGRVVLDPRFQEKGAEDSQAVRALAAELERKYPPQELANNEMQYEQWAHESNAIARTLVYPGITTTDNKKYCRLSREYVERSNAQARQRLVLAAARLAVLLNDTLSADVPGKVPAPYPAGPASP